MDVKDLHKEATLGERKNDGSKYATSGVTLPYSRNKSYQDVSSVSLGKVDAQTSRPCAVIGPDRVLPPPVSNDTLKKNAYEAWYADSVYRHPPEYPHKMTNYHTPIRNISPRQTFQENMQRIMVPPTYNTLKGSDEHNFPTDKTLSLPKNAKPNIPLETKYCDVPYSGSLSSNEQKGVRNTEQCVSNVNPVIVRSAPQGWPTHLRPSRPYGAPELYQYPEYTNCAGPRPVPMTRPHRTHEDPSHGYPDPYCHDGNIRFKPYTTVKDRYPQARYEFIGNYPSPFHPPSAFPPHKYDMPKSIPQPYAYPQVPLKYLDSRIPDPLIDGYQRPTQQNNYNLPFHNQVIHPAYGPVLGNCIQNKYPCPPEGSVKSVALNKPPYDTNKMYGEYENARTKGFPVSENYYFNEMQRPSHHVKSQLMSNFPVNMHGIPSHPYYRKENSTMKNYEYMSHFRNIDPSLLSQSRIPSQFSPNAIAISPTDTNLTLETSQIQGGPQEDCGYVSQSPTASIRSADYVNRSANEFYRRYDPRYGPTIRQPVMMTKPEQNHSGNSKDKKDIDVRQFLQMWNEVDDENAENANKEAVAQLQPNDINKATSQYESVKNQDQLYVLGLVNVPSEELGKYEHIQKVSKLPENIKGYNSIELLNQFEEVIESSNVESFKTKSSNSRDINYQMSLPHQSLGLLPRPVSPLDVEAKISQSVIHKEVGCNFEIKPCSPKMLNVEAATPIQNLLGERAIEKVSNPLIVTPPMLHEGVKMNCKILTRQEQIKSPHENLKNTSCKMTNTQFKDNDSMRPNYSIQDLESNSGVCLASLPRLDNDIELNFPEVNQQFINANKGESVNTPTEDLPSLMNIEQSDTESPKLESNLREDTETNYEFSANLDSEREFSKLSKYRKIKKCGPESLEKETSSFSSTQNMRTDSVIIKNPENIKIYAADSLELKQDKVMTNNENLIDEICIDQELSNKLSTDIAIDFSLNKSDNSYSVTSAVDYCTGNRLKSDKIKNSSKVSQNARSDLLKDQKIENESKPETHLINDVETLVKYEIETEGTLPNDYHETQTQKSSIVFNQHHGHFSPDNKIVDRNESNESILKCQSDDDIPINEVPRKIYDKEKCCSNSYENLEETHNINTVNANENCKTSNQIDINDHHDSFHCKKEDNACILLHSPSNDNKYSRNSRKTGSFELFSEESEGYDTDSNENSGKNKNNDIDKINKLDNVHMEEDEIGKIKEKIHDRVSNVSKEQISEYDEFNVALQNVNTEGIIHNIDVVEKTGNEDTKGLQSKEIDGRETNVIKEKISESDELNEVLINVNTEGKIHNIDPAEKPRNEDSNLLQSREIDNRDTNVIKEKISESDDLNKALLNVNTEGMIHNIDEVEKTGNKNSNLTQSLIKNSDSVTVETNNVIKISHNVIETDKIAKNLAVEDEMLIVKNDISQIVIIGKNLDVDRNKSQSEPKLYKEEDENKINDLERETDFEDINKFKNEHQKLNIEENLNESVEKVEKYEMEATESTETQNLETSHLSPNANKINGIESKLEFEDNEIIKNIKEKEYKKINKDESWNEYGDKEEKIEKEDMDGAAKSTERQKETHESSNLSLEKNNSVTCETLERDTDKLLDKSDIMEVFDNVDTLHSTQIHYDKKLTATEKPLSNSSEAFEINKEFRDIEKNVVSTENEHSHYFSTSKIPLSEKNCLTDQTQTKVNINHVPEIKENVVMSSKIETNATLALESAHQNNSPMNNEDLENDAALVLVQSDAKQDSNFSQSIFKNLESVANNEGQSSYSFKDSLFTDTNRNSICHQNFHEDVSHSQHPHLNISHKTEILHEPNYWSSTATNVWANESSDQSSTQLDVSLPGNELACKLKDHKSSDGLKITYITNTLTHNIENKKISDVKKNDCKIKLGLKKELFSPFIKKLISYNVNNSNNLLVNTILNHPCPNSLSNNAVEHIENYCLDVVSRNVQNSNENLLQNSKIISNHTISERINEYEDINDTSAIVLASDAPDTTFNAISSPVRVINESISFIKSDVCSERTQNDGLNIQNKLENDHPNQFKNNEYSLIKNSILMESSVQSKLSVSSPTYVLKDGVESDSNNHVQINVISFVHTDQQSSNDSATELSALKDAQVNELTSNNEFHIEEALNLAALQNVESNNMLSSTNRSSLKRSLSDSALDSFNDSSDDFYSGWKPKRSKKKFRNRNVLESDIIFESNCHNHRRKSISSVYNEQSVSFCILIDNDCIITEDENNQQDELCFTEMSEDCVTDLQESVDEYNNVESPSLVGCSEGTNPESLVNQKNDDKSFEESWVDDVGCIETVVSDVAEDITISASSSPEQIHSPENDESGIFMNSDHTDKVKHIYGDRMCNDDIMFLETLYRTPQMNVNKVINKESLVSDECIQYYNKDSLEKVLSGCSSHDDLRSNNIEPLLASDAYSHNPTDFTQGSDIQMDEHSDIRSVSPTEEYLPVCDLYNNSENDKDESLVTTQDDTVHSCESSIDDVFSYNKRADYTTYTSSTSPEVSSTTSEERNSGILLKIKNYKGSRITQINDCEQETNSISCKFTELNDYSSSQNFKSNRPLITKAAQKYIPPLKETFGDLKIRLPLPQHSLLRLKQLKLLKEESNLTKCNVKSKPHIPKKPKPKFEDVLKSIDEIQFKMHKEKSKKVKKSIPKVVIKKNENGSHYASTTNKESFNPDLTGRKWQPWVFLEKNHFIDKMALRNKRKAIFSHRKNTYVLAEKFRKYKSIGNAKFIISQPNTHNSSIGHLKCTIRLKHTY